MDGTKETPTAPEAEQAAPDAEQASDAGTQTPPSGQDEDALHRQHQQSRLAQESSAMILLDIQSLTRLADRFNRPGDAQLVSIYGGDAEAVYQKTLMGLFNDVRRQPTRPPPCPPLEAPLAVPLTGPRRYEVPRPASSPKPGIMSSFRSVDHAKASRDLEARRAAFFRAWLADIDSSCSATLRSVLADGNMTIRQIIDTWDSVVMDRLTHHMTPAAAAATP